MAEQITIRKGIQTKKITRYAWDLMGENKNGWELTESSDQIVANEVSKGVVDAGVVVNESEPVVNQIVANGEVLEPAATGEETIESDRENFIAVATEAKLKTGVIKDFLDINNVEYKQKDKPEVLIEKLADFFVNDVEKFKAEFSI